MIYSQNWWKEQQRHKGAAPLRRIRFLPSDNGRAASVCGIFLWSSRYAGVTALLPASTIQLFQQKSCKAKWLYSFFMSKSHYFKWWLPRSVIGTPALHRGHSSGL